MKKNIIRNIPCGPEHFPPGTVLRVAFHAPTSWEILLGVDPFGIVRVSGHVRYASLDGYLRSTDGGKTWLPCHVEIKE